MRAATHSVLTIAAQIRIAAASATSERADRARDRLLVPRNSTEARTLPLRRALLELLTQCDELDIPALRARLPASLEHNHETARRQLAMLQQFGWAESRCASSRRGMTVGDGRARLYRITSAGRLALEDAARATPSNPTGEH